VAVLDPVLQLDEAVLVHRHGFALLSSFLGLAVA
jgi:hypothetical protein